MANSDTTAVQDIQELMTAWNTIEAAAKKQFPDATKEECYQICESAMNYALHIISPPTDQYFWARKL